MLIALVMLLLLTLLAVTSMRETTLQNRVGGNVSEQKRAYNAAESALRELGEETGAQASLVADLGEIYPDVGVFAAAVGVVVASFEFHSDDATDDDEPEVETSRWFTPKQITDLIARGELRDGVTLAGLALAAVHTGVRLA